jgi:hypothetical protein
MAGTDNSDLGVPRQRAAKRGKEPDFTTPPYTNAERAEEKLFREALDKDKVISGVRTHLGDKK